MLYAYLTEPTDVGLRHQIRQLPTLRCRHVAVKQGLQGAAHVACDNPHTAIHVTMVHTPPGCSTSGGRQPAHSHSRQHVTHTSRVQHIWRATTRAQPFTSPCHTPPGCSTSGGRQPAHSHSRHHVTHTSRVQHMWSATTRTQPFTSPCYTHLQGAAHLQCDNPHTAIHVSMLHTPHYEPQMRINFLNTKEMSFKKSW